MVRELEWQERPGATALGVVAHYVVAHKYRKPVADQLTEAVTVDVVEYVDGSAALIHWRTPMSPVRTTHRSVVDAKIEAQRLYTGGV